MKIVTIITIIFLLLALLGSIGGASYYYYNSVEEMKEQVFNHLETAAQSRAHHVESFFNDKKILSENLALIGKVERLLLKSKSNPDYNKEVKEVNERLQKTVDENEEIYRIRVLDKDSIVIASTSESDIGLDRKTIFSGENQKILIREIKTSEEKDLALINIQQPVFVNNEFLGLIILDIELSALHSITTDKTGLGETGEIYLINNDKYLLSPCRFMTVPACKVLTQKVDTINSRNCFSHSQENEEGYERHEEVQVFLDYRGEKVIGTHVYLSDVDLCLLAEMDESEILGKQRELFQGIVLKVTIFLTIIIGLIGYFLGRYLSKIFILKRGKKRL